MSITASEIGGRIMIPIMDIFLFSQRLSQFDRVARLPARRDVTPYKVLPLGQILAVHLSLHGSPYSHSSHSDWSRIW